MTIQYKKYFESETVPQDPFSPKEAKYDGMKMTLGVICTVALLATAATLIYMAVVKGKESASYPTGKSYYMPPGRTFVVVHNFDGESNAALGKAFGFGLLATIPCFAAAMKVNSLLKSKGSYENKRDKYKDLITTLVALAILAAVVYSATQLKSETALRHYHFGRFWDWEKI